MTDLVNRLREPERWWSCVGPLRGHTQKAVNLTPYEAADTIEQQEAEIKRLREELDYYQKPPTPFSLSFQRRFIPNDD